MRHRIVGGLQNLLLTLGSLVSVLLLCELALRLFYPAGGQPKIFEFDPILGHKMRPDIDIVQVWPGHENVSTIRTNSHGFRGPDIPATKHPDEVRILLLGDSYTFGFGVDEQDGFANLLQERFAPDGSADPRVRVINAGVSAYGTAQELLQYETVGRSLLPDVVVLHIFVGNDVQNNLCLGIPRLRPHRRAPCFKVENGMLDGYAPALQAARGKARKVTLRRRFVSWVKSLQVYKLTFQRAVGLVTTNPGIASLMHRAGLEVGPGYLPHVVAGWYQQPTSDQGWEMTRLLLSRLHEQVLLDGARLLVVIIPSRIQVIPEMVDLARTFYPDDESVAAFLQDQLKPQSRLSAFLESEGIPTLDLLPILRADGRGGGLYYPAIAHWNEEGHLIAAAEIHRFISQQDPSIVPVPLSRPDRPRKDRGDPPRAGGNAH